MPDAANVILLRNIASRDVAINRIGEILEVARAAKLDLSRIAELKIRFTKLESVYKQFESFHSKIVNLKSESQDEGALQEEEAIRKALDMNYFEIKIIYHELVEITASSSDSISESTKSPSFARLPKISLPMYDGNLKQWPNFRDLFTSLVDKHPSLSNIEKFQYLLSCTSGEALQIVKGVTLSYRFQ